MTKIRNHREPEAAMTNLIQLFPKSDRPYKAQAKDEPWVVFLLWIPDVEKGYVGMALDRGDDLKTLAQQAVQAFYRAKANTDSKHPLDMVVAKLKHQSEIQGKILIHCSNKQRAIQARRRYIEKLQPQLNKPDYIKVTPKRSVENKIHA